MTHWFRRFRTTRPHHLWADLRALVVLGTLAVVAIPEFVEPPPYQVSHTVLEVALGLVLFYFGVR